ncbi:MAG: cell wall hydrolase [Bradyrhizobium sp.]|nr:cell wall hydrolase [Bradyrhizobium sp.]
MNKSVLAGAAAVLATLGGVLAYCVVQGVSGGRRSNPPAVSRSVRQGVQPLAPPGAPPVTAVDYQPIAPQTAVEINSAVPIESVGPAAKPFRIATDTPTWDRAAHCLAQAVYYEAETESLDGQRAVAQVVLNRVRSRAFPDSVCGVVYQGSERTTGCQFTFTCDGSLKREPSSAGWQRALTVATSALQGKVYAPVGNATHYHANYVVPYWAASMAKIRVIGAHDFYRWPGNWRAATYFSQRYANIEPQQIVALAAGTAPPVQSAVPAAMPALPPALAADRALFTHGGSKIAPAIDRSPHTLIAGENTPALDPKLNRIVILSADLQGGKLEASPSLRATDR